MIFKVRLFSDGYSADLEGFGIRLLDGFDKDNGRDVVCMRRDALVVR